MEPTLLNPTLFIFKRCQIATAHNARILDRMTRDQTFPGPSGLLVNLKLKKELLTTILYSYMLSHSIHYKVITRLNHANKKKYL